MRARVSFSGADYFKRSGDVVFSPASLLQGTDVEALILSIINQ